MSGHWGERIAVRLMARLTAGRYAESLAGDLEEELRMGRSPYWLWWQVLAAARVRGTCLARQVAVPAAFAMGWCLLYPAWEVVLWKHALTEELFARWSALDWPASAMLQIGGGVLPATSFVWAGVLLALLLEEEFRELSAWRVAGGLSLSLSVLLTMGLALLNWGGTVLGGSAPMGRIIFFPAAYHGAECFVLAVSVLVGVLAARTRAVPVRVS